MDFDRNVFCYGFMDNDFFLMGYQFDKLEVSESVTIPYFLLFLDLF